MDKERAKVAAVVLERLCNAYGRNGEPLRFSDDSFKEWQRSVGHLSMETAEATVDLCISSYKWLPSIHEFLDLSRSIRRHEIDASRDLNAPLPEHIIELQSKGLAVQRDIAQARAGRDPHDHTQGWEQCPVCSGASNELDSDECRTCFLLETHGLQAIHCTDG